MLRYEDQPTTGPISPAPRTGQTCIGSGDPVDARLSCQLSHSIKERGHGAAQIDSVLDDRDFRVAPRDIPSAAALSVDKVALGEPPAACNMQASDTGQRRGIPPGPRPCISRRRRLLDARSPHNERGLA